MTCSEMLAELQNISLPQGKQTPICLMEICGTHTMAIAKAGLRQLLPESVKLISGPGCPVCVTPAGAMDEVLRIAKLPNVIIACYGDLIRIPGSVRGDSLAARKAQGANVRVVYSAMDALELAKQEPDKQVVFLGVGFETTAPGTAVCILEAKERGLKNFSVLSMLKYTEPAVRHILEDGECRLDGLICPGHVATIVGAESFRFLPQEYSLPGVVAGFETEDVVKAVYRLCRMIAEGRADLENGYLRGVRAEGNPTAKRMMEQVFERETSVWRGLGEIPRSGMKIRAEFAEFDASKRFSFAPENKEQSLGCRCGEILKGLMPPEECPLFGKVCTPADPVGPCMVSGEGACAAAYKYRSI